MNYTYIYGIIILKLREGVNLINTILILTTFIITFFSIWAEVKKFNRDKVNYSIFDRDTKKLLFVVFITLCAAGITPQYLRLLTYAIVLMVYVIMSNILSLITYRISKNFKPIKIIILLDIATVLLITFTFFV